MPHHNPKEKLEAAKEAIPEDYMSGERRDIAIRELKEALDVLEEGIDFSELGATSESMMDSLEKIKGYADNLDNASNREEWDTEVGTLKEGLKELENQHKSVFE